jgi:hypothetical protein
MEEQQTPSSQKPIIAPPTATMFVRLNGGNWPLEEMIPTVAKLMRPVRRYNTRVVPTHAVKWPRVFALNIGAHLF